MEKAEIRPLATPKPLDHYLKKIGMYNVVEITQQAKFYRALFRGFCSRRLDSAPLLG